MCYSKPGPRCSTHVKATLDNAIKSGDKAAISDAADDWMTTPDYINNLETTADILRESGDAEDEKEAVKVEEAADKAKAIRQAQLDAWKAANPDKVKQPAKKDAPVAEIETPVVKPAAPVAVQPQIPSSLMAPAGPVLPAHLSSTGRARTADGAHVEGDDVPTHVVTTANAPIGSSQTTKPSKAQAPMPAKAKSPRTTPAKEQSPDVSKAAAVAPLTFGGMIRESLKTRADRVRARESHDPKQLAAYAQHEDAEVRAAAATNALTPRTALTRLATDRDLRVRAAVAANPRTDVRTLRDVIAKDCDSEVRDAMAGNPSVPSEVLHTLAKTRSGEVKMKLANNPSAAPETLGVISRNASPDLKLALAANSSTPGEVLDGYYRTPEQAKRPMKDHPDDYAHQINAALAKNPNVSPDVLRSIRRTCDSWWTRRDAKRTLRSQNQRVWQMPDRKTIGKAVLKELGSYFK